MELYSEDKLINIYNSDLVTLGFKLSMKDYVYQTNNIFYNINKSFIDNFIDFIDKDLCCIPRIYLKQYKIIDKYNNILILFKTYNFIENIDYKLISHNDTYNIHPEAFKKMLIKTSITLEKQFFRFMLTVMKKWEISIKIWND